MKQVTIENVRERIAELEMVNSHGELSLRGEFELACLRKLADSMVGVDDDVRNVVTMLENNEWAEHCTKTELGQHLESEITRLVGDVQPVPVVSDADPSLNAMMRALDAFYADDDVPERAMLAAFRILLADVGSQPAPVSEKMIDTFEAEFRRAFDVSAGVEQLIEIGYQGEKFSLSIRDAATWWKLGRDAMLQGAEPVPATDNTAQQFEALATSGKSEHLLNAERIAREAQALSNSLNATSEVNHRVSGWSDRQQKVIAYSLWRFSCTAYQKANQAAQTNNKDMFDRFIREARCAEEIREEFTSAWSGKQ